jgi:pyruvate ferredoxin oxidoreductase gamma subunit
MITTAVLPDPSRFYGIRFESIGGLGAHTAGKILAQTSVLKMDLNGAHFSSYGSEKKGSVVRSYIRLGPSDRPIRTSAPIDSPDVIVVFHNSLLQHPVTLAGLRSAGVLIFNGAEGEVHDLMARVPAGVRIARVDALRIAVEESSRPNAVLMGTLAAVLPFLDEATLLEGLCEGFAHRSKAAVEANERAFRRGAAEFEIIENSSDVQGDLPVVSPRPVWGYDTAPIGGVLPNPGNTVANDLTTSRTGWIPVFQEDKCIHCGLCTLVCPDYCLAWTEDPAAKEPPLYKLLGVDYRYCKGCLRCIESCPTEALTKEAETPGLAELLRVPLQFESVSSRGMENG